MKAVILHPAYHVVEKVCRAFSDSNMQAEIRAELIVANLAHAGHLSGGEFVGGHYCVSDNATHET